MSYLVQARAEGLGGRLTWVPPALGILVKDEGGSTAGFVHRAYVSCGTNQFAFMMPADFQLGQSSPDKIVLVSENHLYAITLNLVGPATAGGTNPLGATFRRDLLAHYAGAEITEEFSRSVADHAGTAFDLKWRNSAGTQQAIRTAYVPFRAGMLQFTLLTTADKFAEGSRYFDTLLLTFQSNETGKIEPAAEVGDG